MGVLLHAQDVYAGYGGTTVVHGMSLHVNAGELACLLGPSGCGKSTVLRAIAGFVPLTSGEISLRGTVVSSQNYVVPPELRHLGIVFQDFALFPHLSVAANVAFGLRGLSRRESALIVADLLAVVGLTEASRQFPHELSGGQQQRVALARALAPNPEMVLLDEPFSNLDIELRERLGTEVRDILKARGITAILVTHDQQEAFALADHVGVMRDGRLLQWDTAYNLYHEPANRFVADFVGQGVLLRGQLRTPDSVVTSIGLIQGNRAYPWPPGTEVEVLLRPDDVLHDPHGDIEARVVATAFKGAETLYTLEVNSSVRLLCLLPSHLDRAVGDAIRIAIAADHLVIFPREAETA